MSHKAFRNRSPYRMKRYKLMAYQNLYSDGGVVFTVVTGANFFDVYYDLFVVPEWLAKAHEAAVTSVAMIENELYEIEATQRVHIRVRSLRY